MIIETTSIIKILFLIQKKKKVQQHVLLKPTTKNLSVSKFWLRKLGKYA